jgi:hypothetical protein
MGIKYFKSDFTGRLPGGNFTNFALTGGKSGYHVTLGQFTSAPVERTLLLRDMAL